MTLYVLVLYYFFTVYMANHIGGLYMANVTKTTNMVVFTWPMFCYNVKV